MHADDDSAPPVDTPPSGTKTPSYIVGVGASAGGLEALETLFHNMPARSGSAFVVIQHLSPDFESRMDELLARQTDMPIRQAVNGMEIEPDTIYLVPPRKEIIVSEGKLLLTERDNGRGFSLPIDRFFRSLAQDRGPNGIGIVLSGTGSDGSRGIRDIHEAGGVVMVQSEESAKFDGMPRSAIDTGVVDLVLAPEAMPAAIIKYANNTHSVADLDRDAVPDSALARIFRMLRHEYGIDFGHYKSTTVARRIERRLPMTDARGLDEYATYLTDHPEEAAQLYRDLLIGVTRFFRDEEAFRRLEMDIIPAIVEGATAEEGIRVWDAGCGTGEEAYSLAILFHQALERKGRSVDLKIFATDVHAASLTVASQGCYREEALEGVRPEHLERYFKKERHEYQVSPELRQSIVFARHNVIRDAPFTRMDLVVCRNLLIYLQPHAQKKVLSLFHFGLKTNGYLFLGPSETPSDLSEEFDVLDSRWRMYRKMRDIRFSADLRLPLVPTLPTARPREGLSRHFPERQVVPLYDRLLERFMPPGFLVNGHFEIVHTFGGAERFLRVRSGRPSTSLLDLIHDGLKTPLMGALQHAERNDGPVQYSGLRMAGGEGGKDECLRVAVEPLANPHGCAKHFVVVLESERAPAPTTMAKGVSLSIDEVTKDYIDSLEVDLRFTKENLQATIEELQTSNEELQATNEELTASNEELQSTNEELHSVNEELYTVNAEHQRKIDELTVLTNDMDNLLHSADIGVVFLDRNLCIRKFTSRVTDLFRLLPQDVGRDFDAFVHAVDSGPLVAEVRSVLAGGDVIEREVRNRAGDAYLMRILPYRIHGRSEGVLLTFVDISSIKATEADVRRLSAIVESSRDPIVGTDLEGRVLAWNDGAADLYQYSAKEALGHSIFDLIVPPERVDELQAIYRRVGRGDGIEYLESVRRKKSGVFVNVSVGISPIHDERDAIVGASAIDRDITDRVLVEEKMREAVLQRERFLAMLSHELRNPLAAMVNASAVIAENPGDEVLAKARTTMVRQARHMARLLDDLLDVSRMRQDRIEMRKELIDLRETVDDVLESVRSYATEAGVNIETDICRRPLVINADPARMRQIQVNLLTNAIKFSGSGTTTKLCMAKEEGRAVIRVLDEGFGISDQLLDAIFQPFVRGPVHGDRDRDGMGLGLALVQTMVRAHGGEVTAESGGEQRGSVFTVSLPLAAISTHDADPPEASSRAAPKTVLLVEDQEDNRQLMEALLKQRGFEVYSAPDGPAALEMIDGLVPDVALVDIGLPGMSGLEVAAELRKRPGADRMLLLALTGYGQQRDRERVLSAGFDRHLVKPIEPELLFRVLSEPPERLRDRN